MSASTPSRGDSSIKLNLSQVSASQKKQALRPKQLVGMSRSTQRPGDSVDMANPLTDLRGIGRGCSIEGSNLERQPQAERRDEGINEQQRPAEKQDEWNVNALHAARTVAADGILVN